MCAAALGRDRRRTRARLVMGNRPPAFARRDSFFFFTVSLCLLCSLRVPAARLPLATSRSGKADRTICTMRQLRCAVRRSSEERKGRGCLGAVGWGCCGDAGVCHVALSLCHPALPPPPSPSLPPSLAHALSSSRRYLPLRQPFPIPCLCWRHSLLLLDGAPIRQLTRSPSRKCHCAFFAHLASGRWL